MKNLNLLKINSFKSFLIFLPLFLFYFSSNAQKFAIVAYNGASPDGCTIVALEAIPGSTSFYFTDNEYNTSTNVFNSGEGVWKYTTPPGGLAQGDVITFTEMSTDNLTLNCNSTPCGSFTLITVPISLGGNSAIPEGLYIYEDTNDDHTDAITTIHAVFYNKGTIPSGEDPSVDFTNAIVVDGFSSSGDYREYKPTERGNPTSKSNLETPSQYNTGGGNITLSTVPFTNINLAGSNPELSVTVAPASVTENGPTNLVYTFTLESPASSNITVNYTVSGTATSGTDFGAVSGTATITSGNSSTTVTIDPTGDSTLEPDETVIVTINSGTGYDLGNPITATGTIANDDGVTSCPLVAICGINHLPSDGFSFVALDDLVAGTFVYFTEEEFNNTTLTFNALSGEAVLKWTVPAGVQRGDVFVVTEPSGNSFNLTCNSGTCGNINLESGSFEIASLGETFYAYADTDDDPSNGISEIYSAIYTGNFAVSGGNIPTIEDPSSVYLQAVVVDGFPATAPSRTEYDPTKRNVTVAQGNFENLSNWIHAQPSAVLSTVPFNNIIIKTGSANPQVTVAVSPTAVNENSGTALVYTFTLDEVATSDITVNFEVAGTASFTGSDYTAAGNPVTGFTFTATSGTVVIQNGTSTATVSLTPINDPNLEPAETAILSVGIGTGYDSGSPGSATGTINNDDQGPATCPQVAIIGANHTNPDGFSFVALTDITAGTEIYFTDDEFNNFTLLFDNDEFVVKWTAPSGVNQGDVFVINETTTPDNLAMACTDGSGTTCGTVSLESGNFAVSSQGESLYAVLDSDNDPSNGVTEIIAVFYTDGGNLPASEDPTTIFPSSIVVDGFGTLNPDRTEFNPSGRNVAVNQVGIEDPSNYVFAQTNALLSTTPFVQVEVLLSITCPSNPPQIEGCGPEYVILASALPYSTTSQNISVSDFTNEGGSINSGGTITSITYIDVVSGSYPFTITRTFTVSDDCPITTTCTQVFTIDDTTAPSADPLNGLSFDCPGQVPAPDISIVTGVTDNCAAVCEVWINEFHYDNDGSDTGEFVEVAGLAGTDLTGYTIVYYNGANGNTYSPNSNLSGIIDDEFIGYGALSFARPDIQNGSPDGLALVKDGTTVIEFLSYEGSFTANNGPAAGMTSTDIGVSEPGSQAIGESLSRTGTGNRGADFTFTDGAESPGDLNPGQTLTPAPCGGTVTVTFDNDSNNGGVGSAIDPLVITRTYQLEDPAGNTTPLTQTITVIDNVAPVITCPADINVNNDPGVCGATVSFAATATDNCGVNNISHSPNSGSVFPVGTTSVTATATDAAGNSASCTFNVTVTDNEDPTIACPAPITVNNDPGSCGANVAFNTIFGDNCPGASLLCTANSGDFFSVGTTTVSCTVTDAVNRTANCSFTITVVDAEAPVAICNDLTIQLDENGQGSATIDQFDGGSTDNCQVNLVSVTKNNFSCADAATEPGFVTLTVSDGVNTSTCASMVTVEDNAPATAICQTATLNLTSDGTTILPPSMVDGGSFTACGNFTLSVSPNAFDCDDVGLGFTVTLTATDNSNNNSTTCTTTISVTDTDMHCNQPPVAVCQPVSVNTNENCVGIAAAADFDGGSFDPDGDPMTFTVNPTGPYPLGTTNVILTVTDPLGAFDQCSTTITVTDNTPPTAVCMPVTVQLDNTGSASITAAQVEGGSSDACGINSFSVSPSTFGCDNVGNNTVTLTVWDNNGLSSTCTANVLVEDNIPPVITCPGTIQSNNDQGECGAVINFAATYTDNCTGTIVYTTGGGDNGGTSGNCATNELTLSITFDNYPEETSWMILDLNEIPVVSGGTYGAEPDGSTLNIPITLPDGDYMFVIRDSEGDGICCDYGSGSYTLSSNGNTIAQGGEFEFAYKHVFCVETPVQNDPLTEVNPGDFFPVGTTTVTATVTDAGGNTDVCSFDIIITDAEAPVLLTNCPENITLCGAQNVTWIPPTATDNCGIVTVANNYDPGDFFNVGSYIVTYTFYDEAGLSISCNFVITINPVPDVNIIQSDLPTWCQGIKVLDAKVHNIPELTPPLTFEWSNGLGNDQVVVALENGTYFVTVTDALGCATITSTIVDVDISTLLSAYTIISGEEMEMSSSEVLTGGVGVEDADEVEIEDFTSIHTFMRADADDVDIDGTSFVNNFIDADFNVPFPPFTSNPFYNGSVTYIAPNTTMTLSANNYGYVIVGANATLIINTPQINIRRLVSYTGATIRFNQPTNVLIRQKMNIGRLNTVNPDGHTVVFYCSDNASVAQGSTVVANIYAPEGLNVNDSGSWMTTYMTGMFISNDEISSKDNVVWNWNLNCSFLPAGIQGGNPLAQLPGIPDYSENTPTSESKSISVYPNPTSGRINIELFDFIDASVDIRIYNTIGETIWHQQFDTLEEAILTPDLSTWPDGVYTINLITDDLQISKQIFLSK